MGQYSSSPNFNYGFPTPGPQSPTGRDVMDHVFFVSKTEWKEIREKKHFDYIVIGTGFCALAFTERILQNNPFAKILILERGDFFLPEHFQDLTGPYKSTLGGLSETYPWTLSEKTTNGKHIKWQHGMVPFFGGRSTLWSGWCPRPTEEEMINWPKEVINVLQTYFKDAETLLNVIPANQIKSTSNNRPIYATLQKEIQNLLNRNLNNVNELTRAFPAPLAVKTTEENDVDFSKFSTPSKLLELIEKQKLLFAKNKGAELKIATNCTVSKILQQDMKATALETTRGIVNIGNAKLILAMGTLPPTTLIANSFPEIKNIGKRFTSHFVTAIVARIPKKDFKFSSKLSELELGAFYVAGVNPELKNKGQFHIQLTALSDKNPEENAPVALRNMPDVVATATLEQLTSSKNHIVFVCACLGEIDYNNPNNSFLKHNSNDLTTNSFLNVEANKNDNKVWDSMDKGTFETLEKIISPKGKTGVEYWDYNKNKWKKSRQLLRIPGLVHEASTMWIGNDPESPVNLDYRPKGVKNVYITGASLWPTGASWNPTMPMVAFAQHLADNLSKK
ncbi:GMC oxidoreductase [Neotamlana laminarinivorans]|uniref:GMC family oxidoreductase N-terminal domain-containing protein n=1 Tax=Neotamlana laminarinivorans TaxID=2883124 RepID=A0A9X1L466_9FLAO|nr:GMC oxidoreductase [Tamlana laminarinivorans]MCB4799214.1 GMC family oxidoreductase N-terminal domain-containing protein [Tamlana laminarinivorans]